MNTFRVFLIIIWIIVGFFTLCCTSHEDNETQRFTKYDMMVYKDRFRTWKIMYALTWAALMSDLIIRM